MIKTNKIKYTASSLTFLISSAMPCCTWTGMAFMESMYSPFCAHCTAAPTTSVSSVVASDSDRSVGGCEHSHSGSGRRTSRH